MLTAMPRTRAVLAALVALSVASVPRPGDAADFAGAYAPAPGRVAPYVLVLLPATGSNVPEPQLAAVGDILRAHLESTGRFVVLRAGGPAGQVEATPWDAAAAAQRANASLAVSVHLARLADTAVARLAAYGPNGAVLHTDQLGALGPDDLEPALRRLADGLARGGRARDVAQIDSVTAREEAPLRKMVSSQAFGLRLGAVVPVRRPDPDGRTSGPAGLGLVWQYDARSFVADVALDGFVSNLDYYRKDRDRGLSLGIGVYVPFSRDDVAPYAGAGLAYASTRFDERSGNGLQARAAAGLLLGRLSDVTVRAEAGWFANTFPIREIGTDEDVFVHGATLSLTIVATDGARARRR
jgi:hypothetical protein